MLEATTLKFAPSVGYTLQDVDAAAKKHDVSRARFCFRAIRLLMELGPELHDALTRYRPGEQPGATARGLLIRRLAEDVAERKVWRMIRRDTAEFTPGATFEQIFEMLEQGHYQRELREREALLRRAIGAKELAGLPLNDEELEQEIADQKAAMRAQKVREANFAQVVGVL